MGASAVANPVSKIVSGEQMNKQEFAKDILIGTGLGVATGPISKNFSRQIFFYIYKFIKIFFQVSLAMVRQQQLPAQQKHLLFVLGPVLHLVRLVA